MLQLQAIAFRVTGRILPDRSAAFQRIDRLLRDDLKAAVGQSIGAGIGLPRVFTGNQQMFLVLI